MLTDPISDYLTRIRNGLSSGLATVEVPSSKLKLEISRILVEQGYIAGFEKEPADVGETVLLTILRHHAQRGGESQGAREHSRIQPGSLREFRHPTGCGAQMLDHPALDECVKHRGVGESETQSPETRLGAELRRFHGRPPSLLRPGDRRQLAAPTHPGSPMLHHLPGRAPAQDGTPLRAPASRRAEAFSDAP